MCFHDERLASSAQPFFWVSFLFIVLFPFWTEGFQSRYSIYFLNTYPCPSILGRAHTAS